VAYVQLSLLDLEEGKKGQRGFQDPLEVDFLCTTEVGVFANK
jgi:hypothetical protein